MTLDQITEAGRQAVRGWPPMTPEEMLRVELALAADCGLKAQKAVAA